MRYLISFIMVAQVLTPAANGQEPVRSFAEVYSRENAIRSMAEMEVVPRNLVKGQITDISLGRVRVRTAEGTERSFRIRNYSMIFIRDENGYLRLSSLKQLKPGWQISLACFRGSEKADEPDCDNLIAEAGSQE